MQRRPFLAALPGLMLIHASPTRAAAPQVTAKRELHFPRDFAAHPEFRTEWWYLTGALQTKAHADHPQFGFQLTFFRSRVDEAQASPSRFAAKQLLFAHAAVTDLAGQRLLYDQRIARTGFALVEASTDDTQVKLRDWQLQRSGPITQSHYAAQVQTAAFALNLQLKQTQPLLLQGQGGYSRKGPRPEQASYYYSQPQLQTQGQLRLDGQVYQVEGAAWLDHEWSESLLAPEAVGWDWIGMNLQDGSALTAFRLRREDGTTVWTGGTFRSPGKGARAFANNEVHFTPVRLWTSPATQARYPVEWRVTTPAGSFSVRAALDAQELDSHASTGNVYWEGLSELLDIHGLVVGRGYLEMTGYVGRPL